MLKDNLLKIPNDGGLRWINIFEKGLKLKIFEYVMMIYLYNNFFADKDKFIIILVGKG